MKKFRAIILAAMALLCLFLTGRAAGTAALFPSHTVTFLADGRQILRVELALGDHAYAPPNGRTGPRHFALA